MKLSYKRTVLVGLAFFSICAFWQLYDHIVPLILKYTFRISDSVSGLVMAADNVLAIFLLPLFGALSDRTRTPLGRRMPYVAVGGVLAVACMMLIPLADRRNSLPLFVAALGLTLLAMATYRSPAVALMPDVTPKPLRSKGNAVINLMGAVGGIVILGLVNLLLPGGEARPDYTAVFLACGGIMLGATLALLLFVREPALVAKRAEEEKRAGAAEEAEAGSAPGAARLEGSARRSMGFLLASVAFWFMGYNAVTTSFSKYFVERFALDAGGSALVLMIAQAAAIVSYLPVGIIATRIGRKKCILGGVALLAGAFTLGAVVTRFGPLMYLLFVMAGVAWAAINVNSYPMVVEMAHGADVGRFTGYYYTASMAAQIATPFLSGLALQHVGYWTLFPYGAIFVALSFCTMLLVRHGDAKPPPKSGRLAAFEEMD